MAPGAAKSGVGKNERKPGNARKILHVLSVAAEPELMILPIEVVDCSSMR